MKSLSFYEQCGILIPGSVFLFGMLLFLPDQRALFSGSGITVGGLGLFLIISYALGHAVAAVGNLFERGFWKLAGGMPTDWLATKEAWALNPQQVESLRGLLSSRLNVTAPPVRGLKLSEWRSIYAQLYRDVLVNNPGRIETFNGNYGLNRGLAAASLCLLPAAWFLAVDHRMAILVALGVFSIVFAYRMQRFGVHFGHEVFFNFLNLPPSRSADPRKTPV